MNTLAAMSTDEKVIALLAVALLVMVIAAYFLDRSNRRELERLRRLH